MKTFIATCAATLLIGGAAFAQETGDVSVALGLSSFGGNLEAAYTVNPDFRMRGALMGGLSYEASEEIDGEASYEGEASLGGVAIIGDYYPMQNGWRVSGGLFFSTSGIDGLTTASGTDPIVIDGVDYSAGTLRTEAEFENAVAPMITTGYELRFGDGWSFNSEIGAVFIGGIDLTATAGGGIPQSVVDADPDYQEARDDASDLSVYPYLGLSISYQF